MIDDAIVTEGNGGSKRKRNFERRSAQTSRSGWRPRQTSKSMLAKDIAESIRSNVGREITHYALDSELAIMVQKALG